MTGSEAADEAQAPAPEPWPPDTSWLLGHRVELPAPIEGYVRRPEVENRCALLDRRLTVLHAPGGFGKTALLADRPAAMLREQGIAVAWLSLDEEDGPGSVAAVSRARLRAGRARAPSIRPAKRSEGGAFGAGAGPGGGQPGRVPDQPADPRAGAPRRAVRARARRGGAVCGARRPWPTINALLRRAPRNLHVGMAFRERPPGLEIAMFALEGREATVTAEELRFSRARRRAVLRAGRCRGGSWRRWSRDSAGWPLALRIQPQRRARGARERRRARRRHGGGVDRDAAVARDLGRGPRVRARHRALFDPARAGRSSTR